MLIFWYLNFKPVGMWHCIPDSTAVTPRSWLHHSTLSPCMVQYAIFSQNKSCFQSAGCFYSSFCCYNINTQCHDNMVSSCSRNEAGLTSCVNLTNCQKKFDNVCCKVRILVIVKYPYLHDLVILISTWFCHLILIDISETFSWCLNSDNPQHVTYSVYWVSDKGERIRCSCSG